MARESILPGLPVCLLPSESERISATLYNDFEGRITCRTVHELASKFGISMSLLHEAIALFAGEDGMARAAARVARIKSGVTGASRALCNASMSSVDPREKYIIALAEIIGASTPDEFMTLQAVASTLGMCKAAESLSSAQNLVELSGAPQQILRNAQSARPFQAGAHLVSSSQPSAAEHTRQGDEVLSVMAAEESRELQSEMEAEDTADTRGGLRNSDSEMQYTEIGRGRLRSVDESLTRLQQKTPSVIEALRGRRGSGDVNPLCLLAPSQTTWRFREALRSSGHSIPAQVIGRRFGGRTGGGPAVDHLAAEHRNSFTFPLPLRALESSPVMKEVRRSSAFSKNRRRVSSHDISSGSPSTAPVVQSLLDRLASRDALDPGAHLVVLRRDMFRLREEAAELRRRRRLRVRGDGTTTH